MRKHQQKKLLELTQTLNEANAEIERLLLRGDFPALLQLLVDCQSVAVQMGEFIESLEGEGTITVSLLEEYHEDLYNITVEIDESSAGTGDIKRLRKALIGIENSIKSELKPNKIEVVFFPYKSSMSDSLESIYLSAKADPQCDAYWVPIPYYDKLPSGVFGQMHYEGAEYPEYIEITDWRQYDVAARHPDAVFIMNPYDDTNYITSVHPDYYARHLRDSTDLLVYVPYFVTSDDVVDHFVITPGVLYSDFTIVQSEKVQRTYIRILREWEDNPGNKGTFGDIDKKILALGSPKLDKVINSRREDYILPDEWQRLINGKKVVFFNTTVGGLITQNEAYLDKLQNVLNTFKSRDDVALWWRPHPLSIATLESMRPQLAEKYIKIIEVYCSEGWGIYDDTADLHRAIAWSDAYYGDGSSVVELFKETRKPVMLQLFQKQLLSNSLIISMVSPCFDGEYIWFVTLYINALFRVHVNGSDIEYMGKFPNEQMFNGCTCATMLYLKDGKIYCAPCFGNCIYIYNIEQNEFSFIELRAISDQFSHRTNNTPKFQNIVEHGDYLWFIPGGYPALVVLNLSTISLEYLDNWANEIEDLSKHNKDINYFLDYAMDGCRLILPCRLSEALLIYDLESQEYEIIKLNGKCKGYSLICATKESFWLLSDTDQVITKLSKENFVITEYVDFPQDFIFSPYGFSFMQYSSGHLWILGAANKALCVDIKTGGISVASDLQRFVVTDNSQISAMHFTCLIKSGDLLITCANDYNCMVLYNTITGITMKQRLQPSEVALRALYDSIISSDEIRIETSIFDLRNHISTIGLCRYSENSACSNTSSCGYEIFRMIKALLN